MIKKIFFTFAALTFLNSSAPNSLLISAAFASDTPTDYTATGDKSHALPAADATAARICKENCYPNSTNANITAKTARKPGTSAEGSSKDNKSDGEAQ